MKGPNFFEALKKGLKEIPSCLFNFIKRLIANGWLYGVISLIPLLVAFIAMSIAEALTHNHSTASLVFKIVATIGQIIPLSMSLYMSEWELIDTNENSSDICFTICAAVIAYIWLNFS